MNSDPPAKKFFPSKKLGQNFLKDKNILNKISLSADLRSDDTIIEIGPGFGSLTKILIEKTKFVYAIEKDDRLANKLKDNFRNVRNIEIINSDVLSINFGSFYKSEKLKMVANLPYVISTPILFKLIEEKNLFSKIVIMLQKEVGERIIAKNSTKNYSSLSVMIQTHFRPKIYFKVSPNVFYPRPKVESVVLGLEPRYVNDKKIKSLSLYEKTVRTAFSSRRKMIGNSLSQAFGKDTAYKSLEKTGIERKLRAENLTVSEFISLSNSIYELQQSTSSASNLS